MGSAKAWYFAALGVVALSLGSSTGHGLFDKANSVVDQFRAKTMPYVAMLEITLRQPQNTRQVQETMARVQETAAHIQAQKACTEATVARIQAMKARIEAQRYAHLQAAMDHAETMQDQVTAVPDADWAQLSSFPEQAVIAKNAVLANHVLARVQAWKATGKFTAPRVTLTRSQVIVEGPRGMIVAPRPKVEVNVPSFPERPTSDEMADPI
jgi:ATP-dependent Clp protease ATP-binding subunit ClpA